MTDYSQAKIYKIECNTTGEVYYGSTAQKYSNNRLAGHRCDKDCKSRSIMDRGNYSFKIIEEFPCNNRLELETRERWWIENNICVNKKIPLQTKAEWIEKNIDKVKEYKRKYQEQNKDKRNENFTCECGGHYTRIHKARHIKTKKHQDFISSHNDTQPNLH